MSYSEMNDKEREEYAKYWQKKIYRWKIIDACINWTLIIAITTVMILIINK